MTYPVTVFRWDDPGAPQIPNSNPTANDVKAVLKACLITGYGTKAALGWTEIFDDTLGYVLQNKVSAGGSGGMVRFWPAGGSWTATISTSYSTGMLVQSAKSYSNSSTSFLPSQICMFSPTGGANKSWMLIGTAIGFYLLTGAYHPTTVSNNFMHNTATVNSTHSMYIGDLIDTIPNDAYRFAVIVKNFTSDVGDSSGSSLGAGIDDISTNLSSGASNTGVRLYEADGGTLSTRYGLRFSFAPPSSTGFSATGQNDLTAAGFAYLTKNTSGSFENNITNKLPEIRGRLPGMLTTMLGEGGNITRWPMALRNIGGFNYQLMRSESIVVLVNRWINVVDW